MVLIKHDQLGAGGDTLTYNDQWPQIEKDQKGCKEIVSSVSFEKYFL